MPSDEYTYLVWIAANRKEGRIECPETRLEFSTAFHRDTGLLPPGRWRPAGFAVLVNQGVRLLAALEGER